MNFRVRPFVTATVVSLGIFQAPGYAAQLETVSIAKVALYHQGSSTSPVLVEYAAVVDATFISAADGIAVALQKPNGTVNLLPDDSTNFSLDQTFATVGALNTSFPNGNYGFVLSGAASGTYQVSVSTAALPVAPRIVDFDALQGVTANSTFVVQWQPIAGATSEDIILIVISSSDESFVFIGDVLPGTATSVSIPGLPSDTRFTGAILFLRSVQAWVLQNNVIGLFAVGSGTEFPLTTIPPLRAPTIQTHPADYTAEPDGRASFYVIADGNPAPTYQWQRRPLGSSTWVNLTDSSIYEGTSQNAMSVVQVTSAFTSGDEFRCVVTNARGQTISNAATLRVQPGYRFRRFAGISRAPGYLDGSGALARFHLPGGVAVDAAGKLYVADRANHRIRTVPSMGTIGSLAGSGNSGSADGNGGSAEFNDPVDVCVDGSGNVFVADRGNGTIRKITPAGNVTTLAGSALQYGSADGTGANARFRRPSGLAVDAAGNVFVADEGNNTIRKISPLGVVTTIAGIAGQFGARDGVASAALFDAPTDVAVDRMGNVYIADSGNSTIRKLAPTGMVTTFAGSPGEHGSLDGVGRNARFYSPHSIVIDSADHLYVADPGSHEVRRITPTGAVTVIGGNRFVEGFADGSGSQAQFSEPFGIAVTRTSVIYVADQGNNCIREGAPWTTTEITNQPVAGSRTAGTSVQMSVGATSSTGGAATYQWRLNGAAIAGANGASFTLPSAQRSHSGTYTVVVMVDGIATETDGTRLEILAPAPSNARLLNLSTRALALTGDGVLIPGFVIGGSQPKRLLIRAVGPKLKAFGLNPNEVLPDPRMVLKRWNGAAYQDIASNDNWSDNANLADIIATSAALFAFSLDPGSLDAVLLVDLQPGQYTVVADDRNGRTGVGLVELYDAGAGGPDNGRLINISNRGFVGTGAELMIPGIVISSEGPKTLLIRAVGPGLSKFGVNGVLADPQMTVFRRANGIDTAILYNDNWQDDSDAAHTAEVAAQVYAFALNPGSKDAALVVTLLPGSYTVHASGIGGGTGVALVEVYEVP